MKRMVKNGDLIDVEPDGSITVAGKPIGGGGGGSGEREITLTMPYSSTDGTSNKKLYLDDETYNKVKNNYYDTIKLYYNDGNPLTVLHVLKINDSSLDGNSIYTCISYKGALASYGTWYGSYKPYYLFAYIILGSDSGGKYLKLSQTELSNPKLEKSNFDALYKLADKPTQDGTYVLKATVSGGAVTYTWVAQ